MLNRLEGLEEDDGDDDDDNDNDEKEAKTCKRPICNPTVEIIQFIFYRFWKMV